VIIVVKHVTLKDQIHVPRAIQENFGKIINAIKSKYYFKFIVVQMGIIQKILTVLPALLDAQNV